MVNIKIEYVKVADLMAYDKNARQHSEQQILQVMNSITEFGFTNPVLIDENNVLIAGHGRTIAADRLGLTEVPAIRLKGLTEEKRKALRIADNQIALNSTWDYDLLAREIQDLQLADYNVDILGFSDEEMDAILNSLDERQEDEAGGLTDADEIPEPPEEPVTKRGDIWVMGKHRLLCGDSTSIDDVDKLMAGGKADLLLTDPPYNVSYEGKTKDKLTIANDSMGDGDFRQFLRDVYSSADAAMKPGAVFYIWHADSEGYNFRGAAHDIGWHIRQCLIWNKNTLVLGRQDYHWKHEPCLYGWKDGAAHYWGNDRSQTTVIDCKKPQRNGEHPTMKPVELFEYQIKNSCPKNGVVLDLFGGSGTTLIAAILNNVTSRLMELDPKYCDVIVKRWQEYTGQDAVLETTGDTYNLLYKKLHGD